MSEQKFKLVYLEYHEESKSWDDTLSAEDSDLKSLIVAAEKSGGRYNIERDGKVILMFEVSPSGIVNYLPFEEDETLTKRQLARYEEKQKHIENALEYARYMYQNDEKGWGFITMLLEKFIRGVEMISFEGPF